MDKKTPGKPRLSRAELVKIALDPHFVDTLLANPKFVEIVKDRILSPMFLPKWVRPDMYQRITGVTPSQVNSKKRRHVWRFDEHLKLDPDGGLWINWQLIDREWVGNNEDK